LLHEATLVLEWELRAVPTPAPGSPRVFLSPLCLVEGISMRCKWSVKREKKMIIYV
jgi:hypothetical protein